MKNIISLKNVSKSYNLEDKKVYAIKDISFTIDEGQFVVILGPKRCWQIYNS